ncbi:uncharacterized protein BDZ99DRAFT_461676 [Mytilinidion resinicola]|uniref:Uncharacterized protein n=1 Tax=Mytilinidion resinicola TaxID=574789 RepID=A0A6A6YS93_9PEZI|nr:uncharacterized protein BDZ99DRAFT_461676 [Mytilinidion resinicola]KAF2811670.1 hypothetical protein BDZ99DRAFT_461676 [Mytilinidion resinicola]
MPVPDILKPTAILPMPEPPGSRYCASPCATAVQKHSLSHVRIRPVDRRDQKESLETGLTQKYN